MGRPGVALMGMLMLAPGVGKWDAGPWCRGGAAGQRQEGLQLCRKAGAAPIR